ncbi:MAG TPA: hypothetical protein VKU85_19000 [bacterium]|nr:hypothetical protein [bacterium]
MSNESLDPRIDTMMAALYGELSESEERAFRRLLETDPALRAEWDELQGNRNVLAAWKVEEAVPSFVMVGEPAAAPVRKAAGAGWWNRFTQSLRGFGGTPAWGLATAGVAVAAFLIADARMNSKLEERLAALEQDQYVGSAPAQTGTSTSTPPAFDLGARPLTTDGSTGEIVQASGSYLTREEYERGNDQLMGSIASVLNEYGQRRDTETLDLLQAMYERVNQQQLYDYRQLNGRLEDLGHELLLNRSLAEDKIDQLLGPAKPRDAAPTSEDDKE